MMFGTNQTHQSLRNRNVRGGGGDSHEFDFVAAAAEAD